jgi:hypothetical protein
VPARTAWRFLRVRAGSGAAQQGTGLPPQNRDRKVGALRGAGLHCAWLQGGPQQFAAQPEGRQSCDGGTARWPEQGRGVRHGF